MCPVISALQEAAWISVILAIVFACRRLYLHLGHRLLNPVLSSTCAATLLILSTGHCRDAYALEAKPLVWLLGPAVAAMARPVWLQRGLIMSNWRMFGGIVSASVLPSAGTLLLVPHVLGSEKVVTAPVARAMVRQAGLQLDLMVSAS